MYNAKQTVVVYCSLDFRFNDLLNCKIRIHDSKRLRKYHEKLTFGQGHMAATKWTSDIMFIIKSSIIYQQISL